MQVQGAVGYDAGYLILLLFKWWVIISSVMWGAVGIIYGILYYLTYHRVGQQH